MANNHNASFDCRFCFLVHFPFGHCDKTCELTIAVGSLLASPLKIFGRRPPVLVASILQRPASETLHTI